MSQFKSPVEHQIHADGSSALNIHGGASIDAFVASEYEYRPKADEEDAISAITWFNN